MPTERTMTKRMAKKSSSAAPQADHTIPFRSAGTQDMRARTMRNARAMHPIVRSSAMEVSGDIEEAASQIIKVVFAILKGLQSGTPDGYMTLFWDPDSGNL